MQVAPAGVYLPILPVCLWLFCSPSACTTVPSLLLGRQSARGEYLERTTDWDDWAGRRREKRQARGGGAINQRRTDER
jgi:hypothetical protein